MSTEAAPIIHTNAGTLAGAWEDENQIAVFKGIPYAQPPVGSLRWSPPQPLDAWTGVRAATTHSPVAWQRPGEFAHFLPLLIDAQGWGLFKRSLVKLLLKIAPKPKENEDCLYLNMRTPNLEPAAKVPVMVWIHGGDHQIGSSSELFYATNAFAHKGVVSVSINYRLGLMGFFAHPQLSSESPEGISGNYGMLDQIAALQWVQANIAAFGGDPDNVTIFGESAGGESVAHLMTSPLAQGLFHRAIMQSPGNAGQMIHLTQKFLDYPSGEEQGVLFAESMGVRGPDALAQLRQLSAAPLYAHARRDAKHGAFYPLIDGHVLPHSPLVAFHAGEQASVPLIVGSNADEGSLIHPLFPTPLIEHRTRPMSCDQLPDFVYEQFPHEIEQLLQLYQGLDRREAQAEIDFYGDAMFGSKARFYAGKAVLWGQPAYLYHFTRVPSSPKQTGGAYHAAELSFVFGHNTPGIPHTAAESALSDAMISYWTEFAETGNPNGSSNNTGNPEWTQFTNEQPAWMIFDPARWAMQPVDRELKYQLLNQRTSRHIEQMQELFAAG